MTAPRWTSAALLLTSLLATRAAWAAPTTPATPARPITPPSAPTPTRALDVDGDGRDDLVSASGEELRVALPTGVAVAPLPGVPELATLTARTLGPARLLAVEVARRRGRALWVATVRGAQLRELARLPLGPMGVDEEYRAGAELSARGLLRWQARLDITHCDGAPLRLFAEAWDPQAQRWVASPATDLPTQADGVAPVTAEAVGAPASVADLFRARTATSQQGAKRADALTLPSELYDGDLKTAWRAGPDATPRAVGPGEVLGFRARLATGRALRLRVVPGDASSAAALRAASRPAKLWIVGARQRYVATLPDPVADGRVGAAYIITLPQPIEGCLSVIVDSIYAGAGGDARLAIAELTVQTDLEDDGQGGTGALAAAVARGGGDGDRAARVLARRGAAAAQALLEELARADAVAARQRLARALAALSEPAIGAPLTAALRDGWMGAPDLDEAVAALARIAAHDGLADVVVSPSAALAARLAAAAALAAARSPRLTGLAGVGPRELRQRVIAALTTLSTPELLAAAERAPDAPAAGDLWRAAVRVAAPRAAERAALAEELARKLPRAADYERRYRLATGVAELAARDGDATRVDALLAHLATLPGPERAALRQAVAAVLARAPAAALVPALRGLAADGDAGVRLAITRGLTDAAADQRDLDARWPAAAIAALDASLTAALASDRWPELRRAAAESLGLRCHRAATATALRTSVDGDPDVDVRQDALVALVTCRAPGAGALLTRLWSDDRAPHALRERAVTLTVMLGDVNLAGALAQALARWRSEAFSEESALRLAMRAAEALGRLGGPLAAPALLDALGDSAYPEIVAAAATGLGALGAACPAAARARLQALTRSDERAVSLAAKRAVAQCGAPRP
ncbi:MAG: HEAT repeat domain-containing protein [Kofleriaceae bacterium]